MATVAPSNTLPWLLREHPGSFLLSFVAGFVDTGTFIALFGLFTAHVTGNLVLIGAAIANANQSGIISRLAMLPIFMVAVAFTTLLANFVRKRHGSVLAVLLTSEAIALGLFLVVGVLLGTGLQDNGDEVRIILIGGTGVLAMGIQNAMMREALSNILPTTIMTGNFTQFTITLVQLLRPGHIQSWKGLQRTGLVLGGFVIGGALGALGVKTIGFWCILAPFLIVSLLASVAIMAQPKPATGS